VKTTQDRSITGLSAFLFLSKPENCPSVLSSPLPQEELGWSVHWAALHEKLCHFHTDYATQLMLETEAPCWFW
jgi:hypothetical protein